MPRRHGQSLAAILALVADFVTHTAICPHSPLVHARWVFVAVTAASDLGLHAEQNNEAA
jgi:hypothetical protein